MTNRSRIVGTSRSSSHSSGLETRRINTQKREQKNEKREHRKQNIRPRTKKTHTSPKDWQLPVISKSNIPKTQQKQATPTKTTPKKPTR